MKNLNTLSKPLTSDWSYTHSFGILFTGDLVITENKFWRGQSWGYNYYHLGVNLTEADGMKLANELNAEYNLQKCGEEIKSYFDAQNSQTLLLSVQDRFVNAKIKN